MTETEKVILDEMNRQFSAMNQQFDKVNQRLDKVDQRLDKVDQRLDKIEQTDEKLSAEISRLGLLIENDISKKIDIIGDGHSILIRRLDDTLQATNRWEDTSLRVINLQMELDRVKRKIGMA